MFTLCLCLQLPFPIESIKQVSEVTTSAPCAKEAFEIWGYTGGVGGTGLKWVYPRKNYFEIPRGIFKQWPFFDFFTT